MFTAKIATDATQWDTFITAQPYSPFLQSWTMGEVYRAIGQVPIRIAVEEDGKLVAICQALIVPARRGKHLSILYGPLCTTMSALPALYHALRDAAIAHNCSFVRASPWMSVSNQDAWETALRDAGAKPVRSPLHMLAEHVWYLSLTGETEEVLFANLRKTTRNLVRRAEKDGVTVEASHDPVSDVEHFIRLHDETRKRHKFTPYTNSFFRAQVQHFAPRNEVTVYLARHQGEVIAASVHMHAFGETSYHHGASSSAHHKIPASYLIQWTAIKDALRRGDKIYNFWGIAPVAPDEEGTMRVLDPKHPFAGVTLFKTGFGGNLLDLVPCTDLPLKPSYLLTRGFEFLRKWKRGF